jgi:hypothetical protein
MKAILVAFLLASVAASADDARQFVLVGSLADGTRIFCPGKVDDARAVLPLDQGAACFLDRSQVKAEPLPPPVIIPDNGKHRR